MNANNANYNNNNKSGIVKKIESNFQLQYKGKMNNNKSKMNASYNIDANTNPNHQVFTTNGISTSPFPLDSDDYYCFVEILAYKNRLIDAIEKEDNYEENAAAKQISWRLRTLQYSRSVTVANEVVVKAGLEKYGWKQVQEEEGKTKSIPIPKKKTKLKLKLKSKH